MSLCWNVFGKFLRVLQWAAWGRLTSHVARGRQVSLQKSAENAGECSILAPVALQLLRSPTLLLLASDRRRVCQTAKQGPPWVLRVGSCYNSMYLWMND
jgi:hypothetical protein